ncbi:MAG: MATE family efflux transporter [Methylobacteriaceae bacterium]|jgi:MATE family multidrug resistance protein|nr:MATE family efflux transporter [Methylobacteriaceae bacterium]
MPPLSVIFDRTALLGELKASWTLSWPIVLTSLTQTFIMSTNLSLMGGIDNETVAAGGLGTNLYYIAMIFCAALTAAVSPVAAVELGRNRHAVKTVRSSVRQGFWAAVVVLVPVWCILWHSEQIFLWMGQDVRSARYAGHYTFMLMWSLAPLCGYMVLRSLLAALERPGWTLVFGLLAAVINFIVARSLTSGVFGLPRLGLTGIGIAFFAANLTMFGGLVVVMLRDRRFRRYHIFGKLLEPDLPRFRTLWRIGLPIAITATLETTVFSVAGFAMNMISVEQMAAHVIAVQMASITFQVPFGIAQAVTVRVGRAWGAKDNPGILRAGWCCLAIGVIFMAAMALLMVGIPKTLIRVFLDTELPKNAKTVLFVTQFLVFAAIFQIFDGAQTISAGMLRGLYDTRVPMVIAAFSYWGIAIPVGLILAFPMGFEGAGIWIGFDLSLAVVAVLLVWRWTRRTRKLFRRA